MRLYLASYAAITMEKILSHTGANFRGKKAIFIPTAGDPYDNKDFIEADRIALEKHGLDVFVLDIKNKSKSEIQKAFEKASIVLVAGGDTFYLMEKLLESGVCRSIKEFIERGGVYIGSSAGSIVCCPTIEGAEEFDNPNLAPNLKNYTGMDIFDGIIIPHAHKEKYFERIKGAIQRSESRGFKVFPLTDDEVLFFDGKLSTIL